MKRSVVMAVLLGIVVCLGLGAQEGNSDVYHLVVIDRTKCPGKAVNITEPLATFAHGKTGYYIVFGKGTVTMPSGAKVMVDLTSKLTSVISGYLEEPSFQRFVSNPKVLEGIRFAIKAAGK